MDENSAATDGKPGLIRRRVLQLGGAAAIVGLAGCADDNDEDEETNETDNETTADGDESGDEDDEDDEEEPDEGEEGEDDETEDDDENSGDQEGQDLSVSPYTNDEYGYELEVPEAWRIDEGNPAEIYFYGLEGEELIISAIAYPPETTLDELAEDAIANSEGLPEFELLGQEDATIESGEDAQIIEWQYSPELTPVLYQTKFLMVITDVGVAYSVEIGTNVDEYDDEFDAFGVDVLTSLTITEPPDMSDIDVEEDITYENDQLRYSFSRSH